MSKSKRVKPEINIKKMKDLGDVNSAMLKIRDIKAEIEQKELEAQEKINDIKEKVAKKVKPLLAKIEPLENGILAFAEYNKDELFTKKRTVDLTFGQIGYRKSSKISIKKTTLKLLKKFKLRKAIRVKQTVDKEAMKNWSDIKLKKVNAKRVTEDSFWYEINKEKISEQVENERE